eukprot:scaffold27879_cov135-Isochrysis_galbana.AAC.1
MRRQFTRVAGEAGLDTSPFDRHATHQSVRGRPLGVISRAPQRSRPQLQQLLVRHELGSPMGSVRVGDGQVECDPTRLQLPQMPPLQVGGARDLGGGGRVVAWLKGDEDRQHGCAGGRTLHAAGGSGAWLLAGWHRRDGSLSEGPDGAEQGRVLHHHPLGVLVLAPVMVARGQLGLCRRGARIRRAQPHDDDGVAALTLTVGLPHAAQRDPRLRGLAHLHTEAAGTERPSAAAGGGREGRARWRAHVKERVAELVRAAEERRAWRELVCPRGAWPCARHLGTHNCAWPGIAGPVEAIDPS